MLLDYTAEWTYLVTVENGYFEVIVKNLYIMQKSLNRVWVFFKVFLWLFVQMWIVKILLVVFLARCGRVYPGPMWIILAADAEGFVPLNFKHQEELTIRSAKRKFPSKAVSRSNDLPLETQQSTNVEQWFCASEPFQCKPSQLHYGASCWKDNAS